MPSLAFGDIVRGASTSAPTFAVLAVDDLAGIARVVDIATGRTSFHFSDLLVKPGVRATPLAPPALPSLSFSPSRAEAVQAVHSVDGMGNTASTDGSAPGIGQAVARGPSSSEEGASSSSSSGGARGQPPRLIVSRDGEASPAKSCMKRLSMTGSLTGSVEGGSDGEGGGGADAPPTPVLSAVPRKAKKLARKKEKRRADKAKHVHWGHVHLREYERGVYGACGVPEGDGDEMLWILTPSDKIVVHTTPDVYEAVDRPEWPEDVALDALECEEDSDEEAVLRGVTAAETGAHRGGAHRSGTPVLGGSKKGKKGGGMASPKLTPSTTPLGGRQSGPASAAHSAMSSGTEEERMEAFDLGAPATAAPPRTYRRRVATSVGIVDLGSVDEVHAVRDPLVHDARDRRVAAVLASKDGAEKRRKVTGSHWHVAVRLGVKDRQGIVSRDLAGRIDLRSDTVVRKNLIQAARAKVVSEGRVSACHCKKTAAYNPNKLNKAELEEVARSLGLKDTSGTKAEIVARVNEAQRAKDEEDVAAGRLRAGLCHGREGFMHADVKVPGTSDGFWRGLPSLMDDVTAHARGAVLEQTVRAEDAQFWVSQVTGVEDVEEGGGAAPGTCPCAAAGVGCVDRCYCADSFAADRCCNDDRLDGTSYHYDEEGVRRYRGALLAVGKKLGTAAAHASVIIDRPLTAPEAPGAQPQPLFFTEQEVLRARDNTIAGLEADKAAAAKEKAEKAQKAAAAALKGKGKGKGGGPATGSSSTEEVQLSLDRAAAAAEEYAVEEGVRDTAAACNALGGAGFKSQEQDDEEYARALVAEDSALSAAAPTAPAPAPPPPGSAELEEPVVEDDAGGFDVSRTVKKKAALSEDTAPGASGAGSPSKGGGGRGGVKGTPTSGGKRKSGKGGGAAEA